MAERKIRARYAVKGPVKEKVTYTKCAIDKDKHLQMESVTEEMECYYVFFPQGHSIRVTSFAALKEMGYHLKPRMVDMETGDVVDVGGDLYDFANMEDNVIPMEDEDIELEQKPTKTQTRNKELT